VSTVIGSLIFVLILFAGLTTIYSVFSYYNSYNSALIQYNQAQLARQETSVSISSFTFGASPNTIATSTSSSSSYVAITLTNSQSSATPNPLQQLITWNPSTYSTYEAANLGNIRFCTTSSCTTELFAWLESCTPSCSTSATAASAWVKLTSAIGANGGTLTIYMLFMATTTNFDGNYWGEMPSLSGTYAQYDNGANVFAAYFNGNAATSSFSVYAGLSATQATGVTGPGGATINALQISGTSGAHITAFVFNTALSNVGTITESSFSLAADTGDGTGITGLVNANTASGVTNGISVGMGFGGVYFYQAYDVAGTVTEPANGAGAAPAAGTWLYASVTYSGTSATSWTAVDAPQLYSSTGGYTNNVVNNPISGATHLYLGAIGGSSAVDIYFNWDRARIYPPNGVMPTTSFGALITGTPLATSGSSQNKLVYSQGLWWAFYSDGTNIAYKTSPDGSTWGTATTVTSSSDSTKGYDFSIWLGGSTIYYVLSANGVSSSFLWRYGTLQASGTISWTISETSVSTTNTVYSYDSIVTDSSGNVWVALNSNDGTNTHIEVWRYSAATWSKVDDISPLSSDEVPILEPLTTGVALIYGEGRITAQVKITTSATGSSWSAAVSPTSDYLLLSSSAETISNTVYFAGLASGSAGQTSGTVNFWSFANGGGSTSAETQLQGTSAGWSVSISELPSKSLAVFYGSGSNLYEQTSVNYGITWASALTISSSETSITEVSTSLSSSGVLWSSGSSSPFNIRFAALPILTMVSGSPFAVNMISLYILNTVTNTLTHYDTNSSATGVSGSFAYEIGAGEIMSIPLAIFAWVTSENYIVTVTTDQGVVFSTSFTSPT